MARAATIMTESDDTDDGGNLHERTQDLANQLPEGLTSIHMPERPRGTNEPDLVAIDADDDLNPIGGERQAPQRQDDEADGSLAEDSGDTPLLQPERDGAQRRETALQKRQRRREGRERVNLENVQLRAELAELRGRIDGVEPRLTEIDARRIQDELRSLDNGIAAEGARIVTSGQRLAQAITDGDAAAITAALEERENATRRQVKLESQKEQLEARTQPLFEGDRRGDQNQQPRPQTREQGAPRLSPAAATYVNEFLADFPQVDFNTRMPDGRFRDRTARRIMLIDNEVVEDGFNPNTREYYDELRDRVVQAFPDLAEAEQPQRQASRQVQPQRQQQQAAPRQQQQPTRRGPMMAGSGEGGAPRPGPNQVMVSQQRKDALMAAGVLGRDGRTVEDPARYQRYLRGYQKFDREHGLVANGGGRS